MEIVDRLTVKLLRSDFEKGWTYEVERQGVKHTFDSVERTLDYLRGIMRDIRQNRVITLQQGRPHP